MEMWSKLSSQEDVIGDAPCEGLANLTDRQREVAILLAQGLTYAEVACHLSLSTHPVHEYSRHITRNWDVIDGSSSYSNFLAPACSNDPSGSCGTSNYSISIPMITLA